MASKAERKAAFEARKQRAALRTITSEKKVAKFRKHYASFGIALTDEALAKMAMVDPIECMSKLTPDPDEEAL